MTAIPPPDLLTRDQVATLFGLTPKQLTWWFYALRPSKRYQTFTIPRRRGKERREIQAPIKPIKDVQRTLAEILTATYEPSIHTHGFVPGRSPGSNAERHERQQWVLKVDLRDFFPSINFGRVRGLFFAYPFDYPPDVATMLAQICCHRNQLPQGAPTSPIISNFICRGLDHDLAQLAREERCHSTRHPSNLPSSHTARS